jgi:L-asparaginase
VAGIVITHGTDTLEETAFFLHCTLAAPKPVVLTCAMRPASALVPDGPQNMMDAISVAATAGARGVVAVCAGTLHSARDVQKVHTYRLDAFSSGDAGPIGYVEEGSVRLLHEWPQAEPLLSSTPDLPAGDARWPRVEIVMNYPGAGGAIVESLVRDGARGIVAAGTGNGTLHHALQAALVQAQAAGVRVVRASRCVAGRVLARSDDVLPDSAGLSPVKARIRMVLELLA